MPLLASLAVLLAAAAAGCGSAPAADLPPAAGPAEALPAAERPAGRVLPVGQGARGVAVDGETGLVAVALPDPPRVALVDPRAGATARTVPLPARATRLALARLGGPVLAPSGRTLLEVPLPGGSPSRRRLPSPVHAAVSDGRRVFAAAPEDRAVWVLGPGAAPRRIATGREPRSLALLEQGATLAVLSARDRVLELYDTRTLARRGRLFAGIGPTHVASNGGELLYVTDTVGNALLVFHLRPRLELSRRLPLDGAPYAIEADQVRRRLWATLTARNEVVELSAGGRPRVLRRFPAVRQPDTLAVDPTRGRVLVAGRAEGVLQVLDPPPLRSARRAR